MSPRAHLFVAAVTVLLVVWVVLLVRRHRLKSKYSVLWLGLSLLLLVVAAVPDPLDRLSKAIGIDYPPATFLFASVAFLLLVVVHFSWELSRMEERTRVLAEEAALLRAEQERLSARLDEALGGGPAGGGGGGQAGPATPAPGGAAAAPSPSPPPSSPSPAASGSPLG